MSGARILVIDDDTGLRESLLESLAASGHEAEGVSDGFEARERLRRLPLPTLIVLDLLLPHVDGEAILQDIRASRRLASIPVVVISGEGARLGDVRGADAILPKPFALGALLELVDRFSARK